MTPALPQQITQVGVIAILRGCPLEKAVAIAGAAIEEGLDVLEVTLDSDRPLEQIRAIEEAYPHCEIGVGSVLRAADVSPAFEAGAAFVVSPVVDEGTIETCRALGIASIPGAATPTEIHRATDAGASAVKVFPIEQLGGPGYLRAIMAPLSNPDLIPTGGVGPGNIAEYLALGVAAVGVGGSLFPKSALLAGDTTEVRRLAREIIGAMA